eukprot:890301-Rhodomonas_salina.1
MMRPDALPLGRNLLVQRDTSSSPARRACSARKRRSAGCASAARRVWTAPAQSARGAQQGPTRTSRGLGRARRVRLTTT